MNVLKKGSKGEDVKVLQRILGCKDDGVFGAKTEELVKLWQEAHKLEADGIVGPATWDAMMSGEGDDLGDGLHITKDFIDTHITKSDRKIKYLVIHYTAGGSSKAGAAKKNRDVFLNREASADFCVDDETVIQVNPDPLKYYCWAVGDGKGKKGIFNKDCISIEMCSNLAKNTTPKVPNHVGWFFTDSVIENTIKLCKYLMKKYNIDIDHVIRHYDATDKACPGLIGWNTGYIFHAGTGERTKVKNNEDQWIEFKNRLVNS